MVSGEKELLSPHMSTFSRGSYKALQYNSFRPRYPASFYDVLGRYVADGDPGKLPVKRCLDIGCGTGVASFPLLGMAESVIGIEPSDPMIKTANELVQERCDELGISDPSRIHFEKGTAESLASSHNSEGTIDLITVAEAIHWFGDWKAFFQASAKLLRPGGTLAYWMYVDPVIVDFSGPCKSGAEKVEVLRKAMAAYSKFTYDDPRFIGPYWNQPGRGVLQNMCREVEQVIPHEFFGDVISHEFTAEFGKPDCGLETEALVLKRQGIKLQDYVNYLETYSGFHAYREATGDAALLSEKFVQALEAETGWDRATTTIDLVWNTKYVFMRRK